MKLEICLFISLVLRSNLCGSTDSSWMMMMMMKTLRHSPWQVIATASLSPRSLLNLSELSLRQLEILEESASQATVLARKSPEPGGIFSGVVIFLFSPHLSCLQTVSELWSVQPLLETSFHRPSCWISTLPEHLPGPSISLTSIPPVTTTTLSTSNIESHILQVNVAGGVSHLHRLHAQWIYRTKASRNERPCSATATTRSLNTAHSPLSLWLYRSSFQY